METKQITGWRAAGAIVKSLLTTPVHELKSVVPFSKMGGYGVGGGYGYNGDSMGLMLSSTPGAAYDYRTAAGELLENSVVAICVDIIAQALSDAPAILEKREGNEWKRVDSHPVIDLLSNPNPGYSAFHLWALTVARECVCGNAYWRIIKNKAGTKPVQIVCEKEVYPLYDADSFVSGYVIVVDGRRYPVGVDEIVHFRHNLNHHNPRLGGTPLQSVLRQIAGDNAVATFHGALLRNGAVPGLLLKLADQAAAGNITPEQFESLKSKIIQNATGEGVGGVVATNLPVELQKLGFSPDELALDKLVSYYETRICAALRVDPMVAGLGSGTEHRTYANMGEALNDFWERTIIPMQNRHAMELNAQLIHQFGLDPATHRISWDYSKVAALQENKDETHARVREDYKAGLLDLFDAQTQLGMQPAEEMRGKFFVQPKKPGAPGAPDEEQSDFTKALSRLWDESKHPRASDGTFGHGSGSNTAPFDSVHKWEGDELPEPESAKFQAGKAKALEMLMPYTKRGAVEAATVVLKRDGRIYSFETGDEDSAGVNAPGGEAIALLHTHSVDWSHSEGDWPDFLDVDNLEQSHVVTATNTYSVHKPSGWSKEGRDVSRATVEKVFEDAMSEARDKSPGWTMKKETGWRHQAARKVADHYGILYRVGKRGE